MHTQPYTHDPCAATTRHGLPCQGPRLDHSPFCAFHDPDHAATIAAGRARGGAAPRRRTRRLPRRLDYLQVAELTGELFVEALNHADPGDPRSLRAVSQLARVLLQAVGRPKDSFVPPAEDAEPEADAPHLLRVYPPLPPTVEALLAAEGPAPAARSSTPCPTAARPEVGGYADYHFVPDPPTLRREEPTAPWLHDTDAAPPAPELSPEEVEEEPATAPVPGLLPVPGPDLAPALYRLDGSSPAPEAGEPVEQCGRQRPEQGMDREWTGDLATENYSTADPLPHSSSTSPAPPNAPDPEAQTSAAGPAFARPRALVYIRPRPRDPFG